MSKPLKICLISPLPPPYGGISHWTSLIKSHALKRSDVEIKIVDISTRWRAVHNNKLLLRSLGGSIQLARDVVSIILSLLKNKFDAIHLTTSGELGVIRDIAILYISKIFGVNLVYHIRFGRIPKISEENSLEWRIIRKIVNNSFAIIAIDKSTYNAIKTLSRNQNIILIPNCVDFSNLPQKKYVSSESKTALFVGWVIPTKGINELIDAWSKLGDTEWNLDIIGPIDDSYKSNLSLKYDIKNIRFLGGLKHNEAMEKMSSCDLFILPSHSEGFPNVVVEAMALSRPIIATNVGAIPEMLSEGAGFIVEKKNPKALLETIKMAICDEDLRDKIGEKAFLKSSQLYSIDVVFNEYMKVWQHAAPNIKNL